MNKTIGIVIALLLVVGLGYLIFAGGPEGRVVVSITDAAANMELVSEVEVQIRKVELHDATRDRWVTVSDAGRGYELLALGAAERLELYADTEIRAGTYDQIRVVIDEVEVTGTDDDIDDARLPTEELVFAAQVTVTEDQTSSIVLDFLPAESLHTTESGRYVFMPVVVVEVHSNANVSVSDDRTVTRTGGTAETSVTVGADIGGETRADFRFDSSAGIEVQDGILKHVRDLIPDATTTETETDTTGATSTNRGTGQIRIITE